MSSALDLINSGTYAEQNHQSSIRYNQSKNTIKNDCSVQLGDGNLISRILFHIVVAVWLFPGLGDKECQHPCSERQQVHWDECVQRGNHVHHRRSCVLLDAGPAERAVLHCSPGHYFLQHYHALLGVCAKGEKLRNLSCSTMISSTACHLLEWMKNIWSLKGTIFRTTELEAALLLNSNALKETSGSVNGAVKISNVLALS